jgi:PAS domain S-box-containing protein
MIVTRPEELLLYLALGLGGVALGWLAAKYQTQRRLLSYPSDQNSRALQSLFHNPDIAILRMNIDGQLLEANQRFCTLLGYNSQEIIGHSFQEFSFPEDLETCFAYLQELFHGTRKTLSAEKRYIRKDGSVIWFRVTACPVENDTGKIDSILVLHEDITQQQEMIQELKKTEELFRLVQKAANDAIWDWDIQTDRVRLGPGFSYQFQYAADSIENCYDWWVDRIHPEDRDRVIEGCNVVIQDRQPYWCSRYRFRNASGDYVTVLDRGYLILDHSGNPFRMIGSMVDISSQEAVEHQLENRLKREQLLKRISQISAQSYDVVSISEFVVQELQAYLNVDRSFVTRFQPSNDPEFLRPVIIAQVCSRPEFIPLQSEDILIQKIPIVSSEPDANYIPSLVVVDDMNTMLEHAKIYLKKYDPEVNFQPVSMERYVEKFKTRSNLSIEIYYRGTPLGSLSVSHCSNLHTWTEEEINLVQDVATHLGIAFYQIQLYQNERQSRTAAELANENKSQFLANMSHELRTPLNAIIGYSEMMLAGIAKTPEKQQKYTENIAISGRHLLNLVNDLLDLAKIESGQISLMPETLKLPDLLQDVQRMMQPLADAKQVTLSFHMDTLKLSTIHADSARLRQVLINLVHNGIKFNREGGQVTVTIEADSTPGWMRIEVTDTGIGIEAKDRDKLFTEFYQADTSYARKYEGTGLGLSLTRQLVLLHGGTIGFESQPDVGSTFTIRMPVTQASTLMLERC